MTHPRKSGAVRHHSIHRVYRDVLGDPASHVFDAGLSQAHGSVAKDSGWYDNEWGYTKHLAD
jgi:glyceraldehyde 3-phosphate dehydrogenase